MKHYSGKALVNDVRSRPAWGAWIETKVYLCLYCK